MQLRINMSSIFEQNQQLNNAPLFEYLERQQNEESLIVEAETQISHIRRFYLNNFLMVFGVIFSVCLMFFVQFTVDDLQEKIDLVQIEIDDYQDEIKMLNVEWYYLTRPDRLRFLSAQYLTDKQNIAFSQVKDFNKLEQYALASLEKYENSKVETALNQNQAVVAPDAEGGN